MTGEMTLTVDSVRGVGELRRPMPAGGLVQRLAPPTVDVSDTKTADRDAPHWLMRPLLPTCSGRLVNSFRNLANGLGGVMPGGAFSAAETLFRNPFVVGPGGALAAVGGLSQVARGCRELSRGNRLNGISELATGALNVAGGLALALASPTVSIAFGAASLVDGTRDIVQGVQGNRTGKIVGGVLKGSGGGLLVAGGVLAVASVGLVPGAFMAAAGGLLTLGVTIVDNRAALARFFTAFHR